MRKAHKSWLRGATVRPSRFVGRATLSAESEVANSVRRRRLQPRNALGRNALATGVSVGILTSADDIPLPCCHDRSLTILPRDYRFVSSERRRIRTSNQFLFSSAPVRRAVAASSRALAACLRNAIMEVRTEASSRDRRFARRARRIMYYAALESSA